MKIVHLTCAVGFLIMAGATWSGSGYAQPQGEAGSRLKAMGPSAVAVARLKTRASGWLRHYLPVDRGRIAGGLWKFVSTNLDTYYHRADSPLMLAQSPDNVIGFASAAAAEEAGYLPGPSVVPPLRAMPIPRAPREGLTFGTSTHVPWGESAEVGPMLSQDIYNRTRRAQSIALADGVSQVLLPAGWWRASRETPAGSIPGGIGMFVDFLRPIAAGKTRKGGEVGVIISVMVDPQGWGPLTNYRARLAAHKAIVMGRMDGAFSPSLAWSIRQKEANLLIRPATLGGASGYSLRNRDGQPLSTAGVNNELFQTRFAPLTRTTVGLGEKMISVSLVAGRAQAPAVRTMLNSLKFRARSASSSR